MSPGTDIPSGPQIQQAPTDQVRFAGGGGDRADVQFKVVATGSAPMFFQWQRDGAWLPAATNRSLTLTNASANDTGTYQVVISNAVGVATSPAARFIQINGAFNDDFANRILSLAPDPGRFEVSYTTNLGPQIIWVTKPGAITVSNGRFLFEDQTSGTASQRFYRVLEK